MIVYRIESLKDGLGPFRSSVIKQMMDLDIQIRGCDIEEVATVEKLDKEQNRYGMGNMTGWGQIDNFVVRFHAKDRESLKAFSMWRRAQKKKSWHWYFGAFDDNARGGFPDWESIGKWITPEEARYLRMLGFVVSKYLVPDFFSEVAGSQVVFDVSQAHRLGFVPVP